MGFQMSLVFALISIICTPTKGTETAAEAYWKMSLGDDISMPKVVKEALIGSIGIESNKNDMAKVYVQPLSKSIHGIENNKNYGTNSAKVYAQPLSKTIHELGSDKNYRVNTAKVYVHPLSETIDGARPNRPTLFYNAKGSKPVTDNFVQFFLEKDLVHPGSKMKLHFYTVAKEAKFMPLEVANSISFSSNKLPEILHIFAVSPKSRIANLIQETIMLCESKPIKGEQKSCATSLESIVDYAKSSLGKNIKVLSTDVDKETEQEYKIASARKIKNDQNLVCHKMVYPYAVFYCHTPSKTDVYEVSLIDDTGNNVKAVAVCHKDTSPWYAGHIAFQLLKVKPGTVPICHFLNPDAMIWVQK